MRANHAPCPTLNLAPHDDNRCVYEVWHTARAENGFEMLLPMGEREGFVEAVTENHYAAQDAFASLDIRNANSVGEGGGSGMPPSLRIGRHP